MRWAEFAALHPRVCASLQRAKRQGRTGQAYLFQGDSTDFLEEFAMAWAQAAACTDSGDDGAPCGVCPNCRQVESGLYTELIRLRPQSKSRIITVDAMRQFEAALSLAVPPGRLKIGIISEAENMGDDAQNAFLKTLEEPPASTMLLLLTVNARRLLPTIRSRCQCISLMRNRQDYSKAMQEGLFDILAPVRRRAGASVGVRTAAKLRALFGRLHDMAEETAEQNRDHSWDNVEDPTLRKQLADEQLARTEAEYVRLRQGMLDGMQAWFLQRMLLASGVQKELLPHPEILTGHEELLTETIDPWEAGEDVRQVGDALKCLQSNVDEQMVMDTLLLALTAR